MFSGALTAAGQRARASSCINLVPELSAAAQADCDYLAANSGNVGCGGGHSEVDGCSGFTGSSPQARMIAAGYSRTLAYTEVLVSDGDKPALAIPGWLTMPFHRIPLIDPWTNDMGWGGGPGCDIIDLGRGTTPAPNDVVVVYPHNGQTDVPVLFNGLESPAPPPPPGGFPSSYPVSIYAEDINVTEHVLTKDGDDTPLEHMWLYVASPEIERGFNTYFRATNILHGAPVEPNTTYRVHIVGSHSAGPLDVEWTFTTGAAPTRPWF